jgi:predicted ferric reductase
MGGATATAATRATRTDGDGVRLLLPFSGLLAVLIGPFLLAGAGGWNGQRSLSAELGSTLGISALGVLAIMVILPARRRVFSGLGADAAVRLHRHLVGVLLGLLAGHVFLAVGLQPARYGLLRFVGQPWRAQAAISSVLCLTALIVVSIWRRRLRIPYAAWRAVHGALAAATLVLAGVHTYGWHRYLGHGGGEIALGLLIAVPLGALALLRLRRRAGSTYLLDRVVPEAGHSTTVHLRAHDHDGHAFAPGQFAWLRLADDATRFAEHPFSYASSAEDPSLISFTIRAYEGFSARVARLPVGTRFSVDGPHGGYRLRSRAQGVLLIAYGIGITPSMSILRTAADRGDRRRFVLMYANRQVADVTFGRELAELRRRLDLEVIHVLSQPPEDWPGERGRITAALLRRRLPATVAGWDFFLCGAGAPVDSGIAALAEVGVPPERVHAERFVEV